MRASVCLLGLMGSVLIGCGDATSESDSSTNAAASENPLTAPADYLGAIGNAKQKAVKTADVASLTRAIQMFQVSEGRFPRDLQELVTMDYLPRLPEPPYGQRIVYNPASGQVSIVPSEGGASAP